MNDDLRDFEQFMKRREDVARAYANGDAEPPLALLLQSFVSYR